MYYLLKGKVLVPGEKMKQLYKNVFRLHLNWQGSPNENQEFSLNQWLWINTVVKFKKHWWSRNSLSIGHYELLGSNIT